MAYLCDICGKHTSAGRQHTHHAGVAGGQWKKRAQATSRSFAPNLHWVTMQFSGLLQRKHVCAKCIKRARFNQVKRDSLASNKPS